jgi:hypothetical protein
MMASRENKAEVIKLAEGVLKAFSAVKDCLSW